MAVAVKLCPQKDGGLAVRRRDAGFWPLRMAVAICDDCRRGHAVNIGTVNISTGSVAVNIGSVSVNIGSVAVNIGAVTVNGVRLSMTAA